MCGVGDNHSPLSVPLRQVYRPDAYLTLPTLAVTITRSILCHARLGYHMLDFILCPSSSTPQYMDHYHRHRPADGSLWSHMDFFRDHDVQEIYPPYRSLG